MPRTPAPPSSWPTDAELVAQPRIFRQKGPVRVRCSRSRRCGVLAPRERYRRRHDQALRLREYVLRPQGDLLRLDYTQKLAIDNESVVSPAHSRLDTLRGRDGRNRSELFDGRRGRSANRMPAVGGQSESSQNFRKSSPTPISAPAATRLLPRAPCAIRLASPQRTAAGRRGSPLPSGGSRRASPRMSRPDSSRSVQSHNRASAVLVAR